MGKSVHIWNVSEQIHLKMRLLCTGRDISMAKLLEELIEKEWNNDKTIVGKLEKSKMKRIIKRWR